MSARAVFATSMAAVLLAAALPWSTGPLRRLAGGRGDGPDPHYDVPLDARGLRDAAERLPDDATYVVVAPGASPLKQGNLTAATQLLFIPSLPVHDRARADFVLVYTNGARLERLPR